MRNAGVTKEQIIDELEDLCSHIIRLEKLEALRLRIMELEKMEAVYQQAEAMLHGTAISQEICPRPLQLASYLN